MQATLIFNPNAGGTARAGYEALLNALHEAGYEPVHQATTCEAELDRALEHAGGLVVAAGGDGTARAVASRLIGRGLPLAIVPLGTANNVGRALGLGGDPLALLRGLGEPRRQRYDVGRLRGPWGEDYFLEAAGCGLYAETLATYDPSAGKSVPRALHALSVTLGTYAPLDLQLRLDGRALEGQYLLAEFLNTAAAGPRLQLAPGASTNDGLLDVVLIDAEGREGVLDYLRCLLGGDLDRLPSVHHERGRCLTLRWTGFAMHVDGEVRPPRGGELPPVLPQDAEVEIDVLPGALELFLPAEVPA